MDFLNEEIRKAGKEETRNGTGKARGREEHVTKAWLQNHHRGCGLGLCHDFVTMILSKSSSRPRAFPVGFPRLGKIRAEFSKARNSAKAHPASQGYAGARRSNGRRRGQKPELRSQRSDGREAKTDQPQIAQISQRRRGTV